MLYLLPIEPLEERYTAQWYEWFPAECDRQGIGYEVLDGRSLTDTVEVGTFLDINSTIFYKSDQIAQVAKLFHQKKVKNGDVFFLPDAEMFGLEAAVRYLATLNQVDVRIYGFAHAGSYTVGDFVERCMPFASIYEFAWNKIFDKIFAGSEYHARQLSIHRNIDRENIVVTGNPYKVKQVKNDIPRQLKKQRVIHTNRPDPEKNPDKTLSVFEILKKEFPDWEFMVTTGREKWGSGSLRSRALAMQKKGILQIKEGLEKNEYLALLAGSTVMTGNTLEENFGYCILEALVFDTIPIIENKFSHPELVQKDRRCLFDDSIKAREVNGTGTQINQIRQAMLEPFKVEQYAEPYDKSLSKIVAHFR